MDYIALKQRELVVTADDMISGAVNLLDGVRRICNLRFEIEDPENSLFLPIRAIESDADEFPAEAIRSNFSHEYLQQLDQEMRDYLEDTKNDILKACQSIRDEFSAARPGKPDND